MCIFFSLVKFLSYKILTNQTNPGVCKFLIIWNIELELSLISLLIKSDVWISNYHSRIRSFVSFLLPTLMFL